MARTARWVALGWVAACSAAGAWAEVKPPAVPAKIAVSVKPESVSPGTAFRVRIDLSPIHGVKINRYPKAKLDVAAQQGLVGHAEAAVGNDAPPPPDKMKDNYFDAFDGLELELVLDEHAAAGSHELEGKLTYFYCMPESGFCAPHRVPLKIPFVVR